MLADLYTISASRGGYNINTEHVEVLIFPILLIISPILCNLDNLTL